jgi:hypothetical protein
MAPDPSDYKCKSPALGAGEESPTLLIKSMMCYVSAPSISLHHFLFPQPPHPPNGCFADLNLDIPAYSVIEGLGINVYKYATSAGGRHLVMTARVGFQKPNGQKFWFGQADKYPWTALTAIEKVKYPDDKNLHLLNTTWPRSILSNDGFGVLIQAENRAGQEAAVLGISCLEVAIAYTCPNGVTLGICNPPSGAGCTGRQDGFPCDNSVWCDGSNGMFGFFLARISATHPDVFAVFQMCAKTKFAWGRNRTSATRPPRILCAALCATSKPSLVGPRKGRPATTSTFAPKRTSVTSTEPGKLSLRGQHPRLPVGTPAPEIRSANSDSFL